MLLLFNNIHLKIMQNWIVRLRHVRNYLFTSDWQYFHSEKTLLRTALLSGDQNWEIFPCSYIIKARINIKATSTRTCIWIFLKTQLFLRIGLPSTRKRSPKMELFQNAVFLFSCGRRFFLKRIKKVALSNENGYVWTRPKRILYIVITLTIF